MNRWRYLGLRALHKLGLLRNGRPAPSGMAAAYLANGRVLIQRQDKTIDGLHVLSGSVAAFAPDRIADIGGAVTEALRSCRTETPRRPMDQLLASMLAAAGLSRRRFEATARLVLIESTPQGLTLGPTANGGRKQGFVGITDAEIALDHPDAETLGAALLQAFERSV